MSVFYIQVGRKPGNFSVKIPFFLNLIKTSAPWHIPFSTKNYEIYIRDKIINYFSVFAFESVWDYFFFISGFRVEICRVRVEKNYWRVNVIFIFPVYYKWNFQVEYYALRALFPASKQYWANISCIVYIFANVVYFGNIGQSWWWLNEILLRHWADYILKILMKYFAPSPFFFINLQYLCIVNIPYVSPIFME